MRLLRAADVLRAIDIFSTNDRSRGLALQERGAVSRLIPERAGVGEVAFEALVRGTSRLQHEVRLSFESGNGELMDADCTCDLGSYCLHVVAALVELEQLLAAAPWRADAVESRPGAKRPPPGLDAGTERWLGTLDAIAGLPPPHPAHTADERLLFVLTLIERPTAPALIQLRIDRVSVGADGTVGPGRTVDPARIDWARDPAVSPGDHALVLRMGAFQMGYVAVAHAAGARLLSDVVATGRALLDWNGERIPLTAGGLRAGELAFDVAPDGWQRPVVRVAGDPLLLVVSPLHYVDPSSGAAGSVDVPGIHSNLAHAWALGTPVPPAIVPQMVARLAKIKAPVRLPAPRVLRPREIAAKPVLVLRLESTPAVTTSRPDYGPPPPERPWVRVFFEYEGERVEPNASIAPRIVGDEIVTLRRDDTEEAAMIAALADEGLHPAYRTFGGRWAMPPGVCLAAYASVAPFAFAPLVMALASDRIRVEKAPDYAFDTVPADGIAVDLDELPESASRFAVTLGLRIGDETVDALPLVLAALRERMPEENESLHVTLPDGRTVEVSAARLRPIRQLLIELVGEQGPSGVSRARALAIDPSVLSRSPASLTKLRAALESPRVVAVPRKLRATLRDYQREGFQWLMARRRAHLGAVLADDMGLGKTVQTLALLLAEDRGGVPSLVVCPKSVLGNWEAEAQRFAPSLRIHVHHGADRASRAEGMETADVVFTTYPLLARDADLFAARRFATVVLDEAQTIKTAGSTFTHAACALHADFRLALSGTPMENHLGELWSVMRFALPELLGESRTFARVFRRPIERDGSEGARRELVRRLSSFVLRRRKEQVASELPPKTIVVEPVDLDEAQRDVYETVRAAMDQRVREALAERGMAKSHIIVLDALLKLRQAVCDPRLLKARSAKKAGSAKLDLLVLKLRELVDEGRRVLVFSQFVTMLDLVEAELRREKIPFLVLTGETQNRTAMVDAFQRGDAPVFLLSLKAGGTGLNLTAADVVIHYDPWWNPAAEAQATDRAHRIGQDKPVLVYKLVGKGTIEEKILVLQEKKRALFTSVMDDGSAAAKKLTAADVEFLFAR